MERQLFESLYRLVEVLREYSSTSGCVHPDHWIVLTYLWSVICDRPVCWACRAENWPAAYAWYTPPSPATMSRRLRTAPVLRLLIRVLRFLQESFPASDQHYIDAKPLCVGAASGDRDVRPGRAAGMLAKGYKLHAIIQGGWRLEALMVLPLNRNDGPVAPLLLDQMPMARGYLTGDNAYDSNWNYDRAALCGLQLVASLRRGRKGLGHQRHSPHRLIGVEIARTPLGRRMLRERFTIDRYFGYLGNVTGGLNELPHFVRGLHRVRLWVVGKLIIVSAIRRAKMPHLHHQ